MTRDEVLESLRKHRNTIRAFGVERIGLFGSFGRQEATDASDLDFVVHFSEKKFDNYVNLKFFLEALFDRKVDLVIAESIKPRLRKLILESTIYAQGL